MENRTDFDLNERIHNWRESLGNRPGIREEDVEELESHLRETFEGLGKAGLSYEEAFLIAARRIGSPGELEEQFATVNAAAVWKTRAGWMVAGVLGYWALRGASGTLSYLALLIGVGLEINSVLVGFLGVAIHAALLVAAGWLVIGPGASPSKACAQCAPRPASAGLMRLVIWLAVVGFVTMIINVSMASLVDRLYAPDSLHGFYLITGYSTGALSYLFCLVFGIWVASGKWVKSRTARTLGSLVLLLSFTACSPDSAPGSSATATVSTNASWEAASSGKQTPSGHCVLVSSDTSRRSIHC